MFPCLKLKKLEEILQQVSDFERPKIKLEQYVTPPHLASHMLYTIQSHYGDIKGKLVADLGCGCGGLTIGTALLDASLVVGFELDADALDVFQENACNHDIEHVELINCDVRNIPERFHKFFDTVLMNPPFGTKSNEGIDKKFLDVALKLSNNAVYSLHKTSTRNHILKYAKSVRVNAVVLAELRYNLPLTYKFHKKTSVDIEVDFYRFTV
ncbi:methyltransferase like 5 [Rhynchophorus ferrugineus]|uniref:methyltransferase like 5 n=1 Tax=Rhynchophorus ferrugineus TaxID=354439 RepID=UPI003FCE31BA